MKIKAVIFDMDGVLIEARDWHYEALNRSLGLFGYQISRYDHLVTYDGLPTKQKLEMLTRERGLPQKLHSFINELKQIYTMEIVSSKCKPIFQHEYMMTKLKESGYQLAVASNSVRKSIITMMEKSNLLPYVDYLLSNEDVEQPKPHPEIYLKAIKVLNVKPDETLIVEDNAKGIHAAKESGGHVMIVDNPFEVNYNNVKKRIQEIERGSL